MGKYILSLDQGTTSSRAILFDRSGDIKQIAQQEFRQIFPNPGQVEHNPNEIFDSQSSIARTCLKEAGISSSDIAAVGITNQRETAVVWDKNTGSPVYNAIVWQDRRTAGICDKLKAEGKTGIVREKTGLLIDPYFSATKILWILENIPGARKRAENGELLFGTIDSWLIWNFTKGAVHATDPSNASRTMLFNINTGKWDEELLELFSVPGSMLPEVMPSSGVIGYVHPEFFGSQISIAGVAGDQQAASFGNGCSKKGMAKNTYGTGCFLLMNTGNTPEISENGLLTTIAWDIGGRLSYALEGSVYMGGAVIQWLRDGLEIINNTAEAETLAKSVPNSGGVFIVPAFTGLGAPYWDPYARGTIVGITRGTTKAHFARAALESIAFQSMDIIRCMEKDSGIPMTVLRSDGGASRNNMLMQCQADMLDIVVERPVITETTASGAAYLAGIAVKFWENSEETDSLWKLDRKFEPCITKTARDKMLYEWGRAVKRAEKWAEEW